MEETEQLKSQGFIGYRLENGVYSLVDFETDKILNIMNEVSVLFDGTILLKHGSPERIDWRLNHLSRIYRAAAISHDLHIIKGKIPITELDKMLTLTDYLPSVVREMH